MFDHRATRELEGDQVDSNFESKNHLAMLFNIPSRDPNSKCCRSTE